MPLPMQQVVDFLATLDGSHDHVTCWLATQNLLYSWINLKSIDTKPFRYAFNNNESSCIAK